MSTEGVGGGGGDEEAPDRGDPGSDVEPEGLVDEGVRDGVAPVVEGVEAEQTRLACEVNDEGEAPAPGDPGGADAEPEGLVDEGVQDGEAPVAGDAREEQAPLAFDAGASSESPPPPAGAEVTSGEFTFDEGIVEHVQMVTSLIEDREVSREEILEMLERTMRQHSIGKGKRIDYILRWLAERGPP
ncbi:hypothetical protein ACFL59_10030 [Planctomycetota bacterium]